MSDANSVRTEALMGTLVTIRVVTKGSRDVDGAIERAFGWFRHIEEICTRFDPESELMQLTAQIGVAVEVSAILFEAVQFALMVAEESGGAFDPTVGFAMETRGFNREHRSGEAIHTAHIDPKRKVSYRDVLLDVKAQTITLRRPLILDLGAVAKGLAVDTAAHELEAFAGFSIDAGGDLFLGGNNADGGPWSVGIRHPRDEAKLADRIYVSGAAVCTSGDYERKTATASQHHILDPRTRTSPQSVASATVVAPTTMLADPLATAVFVMGPKEGIEFLEGVGAEGLIITPALERYESPGWQALTRPNASSETNTRDAHGR